MENMMTATVEVPEVTPAIMEQKLTREVSEIEFKAESYVCLLYTSGSARSG